VPSLSLESRFCSLRGDVLPLEHRFSLSRERRLPHKNCVALCIILQKEYLGEVGLEMLREI
jgi:hypothetical protein